MQEAAFLTKEVDLDFDAERRSEVKAHLEEKYNKGKSQRVFAAGTFTTERIRSSIKDVARTYKINVGTVEYLTKIIDDNSTWTDVMRLAVTDKRVRDFIEKHPDVFEDIWPIMGQPRSAGVHASAYIIVPEHIYGEKVDCFDLLPIRKMDDQLVSEISGYDIDDIGILKNDVLGIRELTRLSDMFNLIEQQYGVRYTLLQIASQYLNDPKVFEVVRRGDTQGVFQLSEAGMTRFIKRMKPDSINDLIAAVALFRPGPLDSGMTQAYVDCKNGVMEPEYLWGTYEITSNTYGQFCIAEHSLVKTKDGLKLIQNVESGDYVQTESGVYNKVSERYYKGRKRVLKIRTTHGLELRCTPDHKLLTQYGWVRADELRIDKHLIKGQWLTDTKLPVGDMKDWCVGVYMANGFWGTTPTITCRNQVDAYIIADVFKRAFDLDCHVYFNVRAWYVLLSYRKNNKKANPFKDYLTSLGLANKKSTDKNVGLMSLMMLSGFYEGDGCTANRRIRIKNKILAHNILLSLQSFHIHSSLYETIENKDMVYNIAIMDDSSLCNVLKQSRPIMFANKAGDFVPTDYMKTIDRSTLCYKDRKKLGQFLLHSSYVRRNCAIRYGARIEHDVWGKILSIEEDGYAITYDLSVEKEHSFVTGGLVTHNCYQEQVAKIAQKIGNLSLGDGVNLVKALSKKKIEKVRKFKDKYFEGAKKNGCPKEAAVRVWEVVEAGASYLFNASHATAYGLTAYVGAWLKTHYPTPFYTVVLRDQDEDKLPVLLSEIRASGTTEVVQPDINISGSNFVADYKRNCIYWSISRIKQLGPKAVTAIENERQMFGEFYDMEDFIRRIFRNKFNTKTKTEDGEEVIENTRSSVNTRHLKHLILAGAFDGVENVKSITERYGLLQRAVAMLKFKLSEKDFPEDLLDKQYFWARKQVEVSGFGAIDYERLLDNSDMPDSTKKNNSFIDLKELEDMFLAKKKGIVCATVVDVEEKSFKDKSTGEKKKFGKISLQQNIDTATVVLWSDVWDDLKSCFFKSKGKILVCVAQIKWSDYDEKNTLQLNKGAFYQII